MKKFDYILLILLILDMGGTLLVYKNLNVALLVLLSTLIPMILCSIVGGRFVYFKNGSFSFVYTFVISAISTVLILGYSLIFPWSNMIDVQHSNVNFSPNVGSIVSTLFTQFALTSVVFLITKALNRDEKNI